MAPPSVISWPEGQEVTFLARHAVAVPPLEYSPEGQGVQVESVEAEPAVKNSPAGQELCEYAVQVVADPLTGSPCARYVPEAQAVQVVESGTSIIQRHVKVEYKIPHWLVLLWEFQIHSR